MTTTVKAKCPGCGDEEGVQAVSLNGTGLEAVPMEYDWHCQVCHGRFKVSEWLGAAVHRTLTDADVEAIASRVVEMMGEGS